MPALPESLAMGGSGWHDAAPFRELGSGDQLAGPQQAGASRAHSAGRLAKFHPPEIVFGPGALAELGHCAVRLGARPPFLVTDPGLIEAGWVAEGTAHLRDAGLRPAVWHGVTPNPKDQMQPTETTPRLALAQGSLEAGMAFTSAILGATHAMSHQVGGLLDAADIEALFRAAL